MILYGTGTMGGTSFFGGGGRGGCGKMRWRWILVSSGVEGGSRGEERGMRKSGIVAVFLDFLFFGFSLFFFRYYDPVSWGGGGEE